MQVRSQTPPKRCEICHQTDCFDPVRNVCSRCVDVENVSHQLQLQPLFDDKQFRLARRWAFQLGRELILPGLAWVLFPWWPAIILWVLVSLRVAWLVTKTAARLARRSRRALVLSGVLLSCAVPVALVGFHHLLNFQLLEATRKGDIQSVRFALAGGANIDTHRTYGFIPLLHLWNQAVDDWGPPLIFPATVSQEMQLYKGHTPLMIAVETGDTRLIGLFIERGADLNIKNFFGRTALMRAIGLNRPDLATILLNNGADINLQSDREGRTALMFAALKGNQELVNFLLRYGANPMLRDDEGKDYRELSHPQELKNKLGRLR